MYTYSRFDHSVGRCSATIKFGLTKGRYPEKRDRIMLNLLQNTKANDEAKKLNPEKLVIKKMYLLIKPLKEEEELICPWFN